jgi:P27 family predicted phage terminase small subunit
MARRGPKTAPTAVKLVKGVSPYRINRNEPVAPVGAPEVPAMVAGDPVALEEWRRMVPILMNMSMLTQADGAALGLYCLSYSRFRQAHEQLAKEGLVVVSLTGVEKPSPLLAVEARAVDTMRKLLSEFGLSPSSRSSIRAGGPVADELAEFMERRGQNKRRGRGRRPAGE